MGRPCIASSSTTRNSGPDRRLIFTLLVLSLSAEPANAARLSSRRSNRGPERRATVPDLGFYDPDAKDSGSMLTVSSTSLRCVRILADSRPPGSCSPFRAHIQRYVRPFLVRRTPNLTMRTGTRRAAERHHLCTFRQRCAGGPRKRRRPSQLLPVLRLLVRMPRSESRLKASGQPGRWKWLLYVDSRAVC